MGNGFDVKNSVKVCSLKLKKSLLVSYIIFRMYAFRWTKLCNELCDKNLVMVVSLRSQRTIYYKSLLVRSY